ncbi:MAG: protein kinase [Caldimonas sp.]
MSTHPPTLAKPQVAAAMIEHDALPAGTRFGEFEILRVLGVGGFGIVYLARDHSLERDVALKEYMPASLAARGAGPQITVRSNSFAETYAIGLRSFINEARLLARFDHPSLVKVYRFWEDNATAYMVMPYLQGTTLRDMRRAISHPPDEVWIRSVLMPILAALELLHREGVYHRDIAPDNILLPPDGPPVLLDFGAARRVISDRTQSLTAILKPSYAPIEQYAEMTQLRQGPWTDLYALGAVIHYLLFGVPPAPATARAVQDDVDAIEHRTVAGVSPRFMEAMSWMLAIRPNGRPQSVEQLRSVLDGSAEVPPRGQPGITLPGAIGRAAAEGAATQLHVRPTDPTDIRTAYLPTYMPTALDSSHVEAKPTSFSPVTQMPTARQVPVTPRDPVTGAGPATSPGPITATVPMAQPGQPATIPADTTAVLSTRPMAPPAVPSGFAKPAPPVPPPASSPVAGRMSSPAPARVSAQPAGATSAPLRRAAPVASRSKHWVAAAAAGGIGVVALAFVGWQQFGRPHSASSTDAAPPAALISPAAPGVDPARPASPMVAQPSPSPVAETPVAERSAPAWIGTPVTGAAPAARTNAPPSPSADLAAGMAASLLNGTTSRTAPPAQDGSLRPTPTSRSGTEIFLDRGANVDGSRVRPATRPSGIEERSNPSPTLRPVDRAAIAVSPGLSDGRTIRPGASARDLAGSPRAEIAEDSAPSAREACGKRGFFAMAVCMDERCELPRYRTTQECLAILARKNERANR